MQKSRKAAGSNREGGKNASSGQVRRQLEWHQARQQQSRHLGEDGEDEYRRTTTQVPQTQRLVEILDDAQQEEPRRLVTSKQHQRRKEIAQKTAQVEDALVFKDESSDSSEDWEEVAREAPIPGASNSCSSPSPSYDFPGTWSAAAHDSTHALAQVSHATLSYASAMANSGIGKASRSIGTAALSSTNNYALSLAGWGMAKTGVMTNELPRPFRKWMASKEEAEARKHAVQERKRRQRIQHGSTVPVSFEDEQGTYMLDMHEMDNEGAFLGSMPRGLYAREEGWEEQTLSKDEAKAEPGDYKEGGDEEKVGDGLLRVFEFDD
ncbi:hypothetical protein DDE82_002573 [Stemphylium lycopersici]|nr:hypothetical protein DDE82_002573 [Stemphylium lycopersici]